MAKKRKNAKERREEQRQKRLEQIKNKRPAFEPKNETPEEIKESATILEDEVEITSSKINNAINYITNYEVNFYEKDDKGNRKSAFQSELQSQLDKMQKNPILEMPDFLTDPNNGAERKEIFEKIKSCLLPVKSDSKGVELNYSDINHRFFLVLIADMLETNDYSRLDEIVGNRNKLYELLDEFNSSENEGKLKLFLNFSKVVGKENVKTYQEQELRMTSLIQILINGNYFEGDELENQRIVEDKISAVIDTPSFSRACQIEIEYLEFEFNRILTLLSDLRSRVELRDLIAELEKLSNTISERKNAYQVMDKLISGKDEARKVIEGGER